MQKLHSAAQGLQMEILELNMERYLSRERLGGIINTHIGREVYEGVKCRIDIYQRESRNRIVFRAIVKIVGFIPAGSKIFS